MSKTKHVKVLIIGSGPAGYTAAIYAARANLNPLIITGLDKGGQLMNTLEVENWPTMSNGIDGPSLMDLFLKHAIKFNVKVISDIMIDVDFSKRPFIVKTESGIDYICQTVIIATGATAKKLNIPSEEKYSGIGVSYCATCDGPFYKNKNVLIIGGGNTAVEDALYLSGLCKKVTLIHRHDKFKAEPILMDKLTKKINLGLIELKTFYKLEEILGDDESITSAKIINIKSKTKEIINIEGVFIAIGHDPNTSIFKNKLAMSDGYILTNKVNENYQTMTSIPGIFAAGDVQDKIYKQAITSAGTGCMAALDAQRWLENNE
ncbi:thioredoxin reductase (NADPH) [Candidatus Kinetoplastibacterium desouzaii TCC079E]|uniref:Thioredoxin reductase n=1 Tax=Candidatus Kinetoplastidibacterium desouzai TCC079E TaxID=1208919 RepID=M1L2T8_9PROT|nr:thioredoxin-disulfide reductase [Candidatus Kinetoplastibacterium desouzaii]AGF47068.1 thioredoxin reductase (NADPH) [Candidatus Kinetoplastibacterium desouzaii TCC079E]